MATTTTNFGWDIPQSTDLVKDGATAIAALGQDIDTAMVDLKGGTTGQVLAKASGADLDFSWVAQDDSNAIQNAIVDAKGDLIGATANDTPARLAVGTNGQVLTADSAETTGLKWATPASGTTFSGASVGNTSASAQSIATATWTAINWATEDFDTDGYHSTSSNTSRITIPAGKAGKYLVNAFFQWDPNTSGDRGIAIYKNGVVYKNNSMKAADIYPTHQINLVLDLAVNDYIQVYVNQTSGTNRDTFPYGTFATFQASLLGA
jgi:hypothetical protein